MGGPGNRVSDLYHQALERAPEARSAFLQAACAGDDDLRAAVESLLRYEPQAAGFLARPLGTDDDAPAPDGDSMIDRQLGPYRLLALLGAGGMGEVYRACDTKLGREVAVKILPPHLTAEPERRARFAREARLLATLNHPHIGAIYGLEESDGITALVLELVEGETLAERLTRGPLRVPHALAIARQIAAALDAAHEKRIVHRDLKPANIVLQRDSGSGPGDVRVKVLDFGLAKSVAIGRDEDSLVPPGTSLSGTEDGRILGTPAYMSPEQARGLAVDKRTDIWAFGCVLFEMLTGRAVFEGDTATDILARVIDHEPDWTALPPDAPGPIRTLLHRCLRKDPRKRLHDVADALLEIDEAESGSASTNGASHQVPPPTRHRRLQGVGVAVLAAVLMTAVALLLLQSRAPRLPADSLEFAIGPPPGARFIGPFPRPGAFASAFRQFVLAPDGSQMVVVGRAARVPALWIRPLGSNAYRRLNGTEHALAPFWSPDSRQIAFFADGKLRMVAAAGGNPVDICDADENVGGTWNRDGVIVFGSGAGPLQRVSSGGETATPATTLADGETNHRWPWFLPDGRHFLFLATGTGPPQLRLGSLTSTGSTPVGAIRSNAVYASGHLVFVDQGLMAQPFDVRSRQLRGTPVRLADQVTTAPTGRGPFTVSETGLLAYSGPADIDAPQLTWVDRTGNRLGIVAEAGSYFNVALSPDDRRLAASFRGDDGSTDIWLMDLDRQGDRRRVPSDAGGEFDPAWSRDGRHIAFNSNRGGVFSLFRRPSDGSGREELLVEGTFGTPISAPDWSADDTHLLFSWRGGLWVLPLDSPHTAAPLQPTRFREWEPGFSPDGRWIVYSSDITGRFEIYVRPFSPTGPQGAASKISRDGGLSPRWRSPGEIFFVALDGTMMSATVDVGRSLQVSTLEALFPSGLEGVTDGRPYDVSRDGQRFLIPVFREVPESNSITVITNWTSRVPG
jgi:eukaryotic-like serine/threonine-protein kinase